TGQEPSAVSPRPSTSRTPSPPPPPTTGEAHLPSPWAHSLVRPLLPPRLQEVRSLPRDSTPTTSPFSTSRWVRDRLPPLTLKDQEPLPLPAVSSQRASPHQTVSAFQEEPSRWVVMPPSPRS